jgi:hypothetical protein
VGEVIRVEAEAKRDDAAAEIIGKRWSPPPQVVQNDPCLLRHGLLPGDSPDTQGGGFRVLLLGHTASRLAMPGLRACLSMWFLMSPLG